MAPYHLPFSQVPCPVADMNREGFDQSPLFLVLAQIRFPQASPHQYRLATSHPLSVQMPL